jgi:ribosomal protein S18 acetylase RimI-like enzyme
MHKAIHLFFVGLILCMTRGIYSMEQKYTIRPAQVHDCSHIKNLYLLVAEQKGGIARKHYEITDEYISRIISNSLAKGYMYLAEMDGLVIGSLHAYRPEPEIFAHILSDLTIAVHPDFQGRGIGKALFTSLLDCIKNERTDILRVELVTRETNKRAIALYESLGFKQEGKFVGRILESSKTFEADIPMAWFNPNWQGVK